MSRDDLFEPAPPDDVARGLAELRGEPLRPSPGQDARLQAWLSERVRSVPRERRIRRLRVAAAVTTGLAAAAAAMVARPTGPASPTSQEVAGAPTASPPPFAPRVLLDPGHAVTWVDADGQAHRMVTSGAASAARQFTTAAAQVARVELQEQVSVELGPQSRLLVGDASEAPRLAFGKVRVRVGDDAAHFHTPETELHLARHTTVALAYRARQKRTCVEVIEGQVDVESGRTRRTLGASEKFGCGASVWVETQRARRPAKPRKQNLEAEAEVRASSLREQNRLLSEGLAAEREGERARAKTLFGKLLKDYPKSPLSPEAKRGLSRVQE